MQTLHGTATDHDGTPIPASVPAPFQRGQLTQTLFSAPGVRGAHWLCGVVKRTYSFATARLSLSDEQQPLTLVPEMTLDERGAMSTLLDDLDLVGPKCATDVIVTGCVHVPNATRRHVVAVAVGNSLRRLELLGTRRACVTPRGRVSFEEPQLFESIELGLAQTFGGYDRFAHLAFDGGRAWLPRPPQAHDEPPGLFAYPRNPVGRGYFIDLDRYRADGELLPRMEDPGDRLTPARLFTRSPEAWIDAPVAAHLGWLPHHCYPRVARLTGPLIPHDTPQGPIVEAAMADGSDLLEPFDGPKPRGFHGAAPGLSVDRLRGDELLILHGLLVDTPDRRFDLPAERPRMILRVPDLPAVTPAPALQTLRIDLDQRRLSLTWLAAQRTLSAVSEEQLGRCALELRWSRWP